MSDTTLRGIVPIVFVPFDDRGEIDEDGLRRIVRFELEGGADGIGINGFASEAYKLTDAERERTAEIVAEEVAGQVPLVIGLSPGSTRAATQQMRAFSRLDPAAFMVLPPATFAYPARALIEHYVELAEHSSAPIMIQHSPHIPMYSHASLEVEHLAEIAGRARSVRYFKIEGPGAPKRMAALKPMLPDGVGLFGGVGGISFLDELEVGVAGVIPGVGFNEVFQAAWGAWQSGDRAQVRQILETHQPLVSAVSGPGHEFSLHARKRIMKRAGLIESAHVRAPSIPVDDAEIEAVLKAVDRFELRVSRPQP